MGKIKQADTLKGFGAICIACVTHYQQCLCAPEDYSLFQQYAFMAVELFFLLSGFLIANGYRDKIFTRKVTFGSFMGKRLRHVYPLFVLSTLAVAVLEILYRHFTGEVAWQGAFDIWNFLQNIYLMQGGISFDVYSFNSPCWFIGTIFLMYVLYYFMTYLCSKKEENRTAYRAVCVGIMLFGYWFYARSGSGAIFNYFKLGRGLLCFFMGVLLFEVYEKATDRAKVSFSILLIVLYAVFEWRALKRTEAYGDIMMYATFFVIPALVWVAFCMPGVKQVLSVPPFTWLGKISMSVYMWHFPLIIFLNILKVTNVLAIDYGTIMGRVFYIVVLLVTATLSYFLIERNQERILKFLRKVFIGGC